ncbi:MAG: hypothetical protein DRP87_13265 [Spirochaetes bacterium]|nr:MAG: hypothetical protein DRP87_13265 [Spirochaetota bacterium]
MIFNLIEENLKKSNPVVLVTVVDARGSSPGKQGFKMLVDKNGRIAGTVGGGSTEWHAVNKAREMIEKGEEHFFETLNLSPESTETSSLCGGKVSFFYELFTLAVKVFIFGCGHVGENVARLCSLAGYNVTALDNRKEIIDNLPDEIYNRAIHFDYTGKEAYKDLGITSNSYAVVLTHQHISDYDVVKNIYLVCPDIAYIGLIGSKTKIQKNIKKLKQEMPDIDLKNLYSPVGIRIGGESAFEIALSIVAEIQAVRHGIEADHLRISYDNI